MSQEKLDHVVAGAIFDFMGWLTTRQEKLVLSSADDAAPAAEAVKEFLTMRGVAQDCEPMIHDWPARCSMVTANSSNEFSIVLEYTHSLKSFKTVTFKELSEFKSDHKTS